MTGERTKRPTQKDIAESLGISVITVQRALRNSGYVSEQMRGRIERKARELGYRPHRGAQTLVRGVVHRLAVFSTEAPSFYWDSVEQGVQTASAQIDGFGFETEYHRLPVGDTRRYLQAIEAAVGEGLGAAAVVNNLEYEMERVFDALDSHGVPYITMNIDAPTSNRRTFVGVDHRAEGRLAGNFLATWAPRGSVAIQIAGSARAATTLAGADIASERFAGFAESLDRGGVEARSVVIDDHRSAAYLSEEVSRATRDRLAGIYVTTGDAELTEEICRTVHAPVIGGTASPRLLQLLHDGRISALIYQNPVLQGYYAVKTLEHIVEHTGSRPAPIRLVHSLMLRENISLPDNHLLMVDRTASARE